MSKIFSFVVEPENHGVRLDKFLADKLKEELISREKIKKAILSNNVKINNINVNTPKFNISEADQIDFTEAQRELLKLNPKDIKLDIVYEDDDIIIINKQAGLTVHPGAGNQDNTLVNALLARNSSLSTLGGAERPGIVHRLDKNTSGLMIVAKNDQAHLHLSKQLQDRIITRKYRALIWGIINPEAGEIENYIARSSRNRKLMEVSLNRGKKAITYYQTKQIFCNGAISLIECELKTGRTHQIRVHMSNMGHNIVGDPEYGHNQRKLVRHFNLKDDEIIFNLKRQALHAFSLQFIHPKNKKTMEFKIDVAEDLEYLLDYLKQKSSS